MNTIALAIIGLVLVVGGGGVAWLALEGINRRPSLGAFAFFVWLGLLVLFAERPELFVKNIGGVNVVVPDVLCAFLATIAGLRFFRRQSSVAGSLAVPLLIFVGMLGISYLRGLATFGLQRPTNEFREFFYFLAALGFTLSFPFARLGVHLPFVGVMGGAVLVVVAMVRIPLMGGFNLETRAVPSYVALAIGQAFFVGWFWLRMENRSRFWRWIIFGFLAFAFLMLHRSVWMALGGGLLVLLLLDRPGRKSLLATLLMGCLVGGAILGFAGSDKILSGVDQAISEATSSEESTFRWRIEGWLALLRPDTGWNFTDLVIGRPMGSGYARTLGNSVVNTAEIESGVIPHNYYLSLLLRGGAVGLLAFLVLHGKLLRVLYRQAVRVEPHPCAACFVVILITQLIYYVPYSADSIQGIYLGGATMFATAVLSFYEAKPSSLRRRDALSYATR